MGFDGIIFYVVLKTLMNILNTLNRMSKFKPMTISGK